MLQILLNYEVRKTAKLGKTGEKDCRGVQNSKNKVKENTGLWEEEFRTSKGRKSQKY